MTATSESWDTRLQRAEKLARASEPTKEILTFYARLLQSQKEVNEFFRSRRDWLPLGSLAEDLPVVRESFPIVLRTVEANGPAPLADEVRRLMSAPGGTVDEGHGSSFPPSHSHRGFSPRGGTDLRARVPCT